MEVYGSDDFQVEFKSDKSPLTLADQKAHQAIVEHLKTLPIPILSEEGKNIEYSERKNWDVFWLVDPLDGTKEFVKRNGEFTVNIALIEKQQAIMGVIYVPVQKKCYLGIVGSGAWLIQNIDSNTNIENLLELGKPLPVVISDDHIFRVVGSRSHMSDETVQFIDGLKPKHPHIEMVSMGSSLKLCLVADGTADCYPRFGPTMEWDTAAGHAIAVAAGKKVTLSDQITPLKYNKENLLNPWFIVQ